MRNPLNTFSYNSDNRSLTVKKNVTGSLLLKALSILVSLLLIPITISYVSSEIYGIWLTLSSITLWFSILDAGFSLGLKNKLAQALAFNELDKARKYISTTYAIMFIIFIPVCFLLVILASLINWSELLNVSTAYESDITHALYAIIICFCTQMILGVLNSILAANQKVAVTSLLYFIANVLSLLGIFALTHWAPPSLFILSVCQASLPVLVLLIATFVLFFTKLKAQRPHFKLIKKEYIGNLLSLGYKFFILQIQVLIVGQTTNFLISYISGPTDVTSYNIAYRYLGVIMMTFTLITDPLWPAFTDAYTQNDVKWMQNTYERMATIRLVSEGLIIFLMLVSPVAYQLWIGEKADVPTSMTIAVGLYFMVQLWMALNITLINGIGCIQLQTYFAIAVSIIHIPLSLLLGRYYGAVGVIMSLIALNLLYAFFSTFQIRKILYSKATGIWIK